MHQSFVTIAPQPTTYGDGRRIAGQWPFSSLAVPGMCRASDLMQIYPMEFTITKSRVMTLSKYPQCRAFSWAVMDEKSLSPIFPVGVCVGGGVARGALVTNDWCITHERTGMKTLLPEVCLKTLMSHVMRLWYFSSSVNSFFKRARMRSHPVGLHVWCLVGPFVYCFRCRVITGSLMRLY